MEKPFYKSKKFVYAVASILAAVFLIVMPLFTPLTTEQEDAIREIVPTVLYIGLAVIAGHSVTDIVATWREGVPFTPLRESLIALLDELPLDDLRGLIDTAIRNKKPPNA